MVGDSPFDIKCANNACVKSVLVDWRITGCGESPIADAVEDYTIAEPAGLMEVLKKVNG